MKSAIKSNVVYVKVFHVIYDWDVKNKLGFILVEELNSREDNFIYSLVKFYLFIKKYLSVIGFIFYIYIIFLSRAPLLDLYRNIYCCVCPTV